MSDSGRLMGECEHGESGFCKACVCALLGVRHSDEIEGAVKTLLARQADEKAIVRIARVLQPRDPRMIGDEHPSNMINEPGAGVNVDDDVAFIRARYMDHAHGKKPMIDFQSATIFAVREWLAHLLGVELRNETPQSWVDAERKRTNHQG